jgi:hypothetical protein
MFAEAVALREQPLDPALEGDDSELTEAQHARVLLQTQGRRCHICRSTIESLQRIFMLRVFLAILIDS